MLHTEKFLGDFKAVRILKRAARQSVHTKKNKKTKKLLKKRFLRIWVVCPYDPEVYSCCDDWPPTDSERKKKRLVMLLERTDGAGTERTPTSVDSSRGTLVGDNLSPTFIGRI